MEFGGIHILNKKDDFRKKYAIRYQTPMGVGEGNRKSPAYSLHLCEKVRKMGSEGMFLSEMCAKLGFRSKQSFHSMCEKYEKLEYAYQEATLFCKAFYERILTDFISGNIKGGNLGALSLVLHAKYGDEYRKEAKESSTINVNLQTTLNNLQQVQNFSGVELDDMIETLMLNISSVENKKLLDSKDDSDST